MDHNHSLVISGRRRRSRVTTDDFITRARSIHGYRYDYSLAEYSGNLTPVEIGCPDHGRFLQTPNGHIHGRHGCPECGHLAHNTAITLTRAGFLSKAAELHGDRYDYSLVEYRNNLTPVLIICGRHGTFEQTPNAHLYAGAGCQRCGNVNRGSSRLNQTEFLTRCAAVHGERYDYREATYVGTMTPVRIICQIHGPFKQTPFKHMMGSGCPQCAWDRQRLTLVELIRRSQSLYEVQYDFSALGADQSLWIPSRSRITIRCLIHGPFTVNVGGHLRGTGCQLCSGSQAERSIAEILSNAGVNFVTQWGHSTCRSKYKLRFDFMLPDHRTLIEYDGIHHFQPLQRRGQTETDALKQFREGITRDAIKTAWATQNGWRLIRLSNRNRIRVDLIAAGILPSDEAG